MGSRGTNIILIVLILLLLGSSGIAYYFYNKNNELELQSRINEQNKVALEEEIKITKNKVDEVEYSKAILISEKDNLSELNIDLSNELKKEKGKVNELTSIVISLNGVIKGLDVQSNLDKATGEYTFDWSTADRYDADNSRFLSGNIKFKIDSLTREVNNVTATLIKDSIRFKLVQGLRERKDGIIEVFARSNYPGFSVEELNSTIIDPENHPVFQRFIKDKPKKFGFRIYTGYGITYNFSNNRTLDGFQVGAGLTYTPF